MTQKDVSGIYDYLVACFLSVNSSVKLESSILSVYEYDVVLTVTGFISSLQQDSLRHEASIIEMEADLNAAICTVHRVEDLLLGALERYLSPGLFLSSY